MRPCPTPARLAEARQRRDETWQLVRQQLLARTSANQRDLFGAAEPTPARVTDRRTLARGFERALADADQLADQLRSSADRLAQKTALTHAAERARLALARARERLATLDAAERDWSSAWRELWRPTGILPGAPGPMLAWLGDAASLRDLAASRLRRARGSPRTAPRSTTSRSASATTSPPAPPASATWPALVQQLREHDRNTQTRRGRRESTLARSSALEAALARTHTARSFIERDLASAADELQRRTAALGLRPGLDPRDRRRAPRSPR